MALNLGAMRASLSLNIAAFNRSIGQAISSMQRLGSQLGSTLSGATSGINGANNAAGNLNNTFKDTARIVSGILISQAFYTGANAIQQATASLLEFTNAMDAAQISFKYFLRNSTEAADFLDTMQDFAAVTPFSTQEAVEMSKTLLNARFAAEQIPHAMTILTDAAAAAGLGANQLDRIVYALAQIRYQGVLGGQEIRQFANANIDIFRILQEELGLTAEQLKNVGELKIDGDLASIAILTGLEKRFKGAGEEIADTLLGSWSTIKDDALILSDEIFRGPLNNLKDFVRDVRDVMEEAREALRIGGIANVFDKMVPDNLKVSLNAIIASFNSLAGSVKILYTALQPVAAMIGGTIVKSFGIVMPIIAGTVRAIALLTQEALRVFPPLQYLGAALGLLLIARTVAAAMSLLWRVVRLGTICTAVAGAVRVLAASIRILSMAIYTSPVGIYLAIGAALLYIAYASGIAKSLIDKLVGSLSSLFGLQPSGFMDPDLSEKLTEEQKKYNESVTDIQENLKNVGKDAEKAGKKVKDKFVASFDELYQIPDQLDKTGDGLDDLGDFDLDDLAPYEIEFPVVPVINWDDIEPPTDPTAPMNPRPPGGINTPPIDPPNLAPVTQAQATVNSIIAQMGIKLAQTTGNVGVWISELGSKVGTTIVNATTTVGNFADDVINAFKRMKSGTEPIISQWASNVQAAIATLNTISLPVIITFSGTVISEVSKWTVQTTTAINTWATVVSTAFKTVETNATVSTLNWTVSTLTSILTWANNAKINILNWATDTKANINTWSSNTLTTITRWATDAKSSFVTWAVQNVVDVVSWASNFKTAFLTWATQNIIDLGVWAKDFKTDFNVWSTGIVSAVGTWAGSVYTKMKIGFGTLITLAETEWNNIKEKWNTGQNNVRSTIAGWWAKFDKWWQLDTSVWREAYHKLLDETIPQWWKDNETSVNILLALMPTTWGLKIGGWAAKLKPFFDEFFSTVTRWWDEFIGIFKIPDIKAPNVFGSGGLLGKLPGFATGGIISREQIARVGEGGKQEAIIPLENSGAMKPFSAAVASDLMEFFGMQGGSSASQSNDQRPILYVGTLIADDRGLKELARRMEVINISEQQRKGLT